ncbi:MAG: hypothetical protein ABSH53_04570 [Holophaga sp.]|jgi:Tfp pilus assembly protein PilX
MEPDPHPVRPGRSPRGGFALAEVLVAGFILAVGLLGLAALQVATVRHRAGSWSRQTAVALGLGALEAGLAQLRLERLDRDAGGPGRQAGGWPREAAYDREGRPAGSAPAGFTVTLTRAPGPGATVALRAVVTWMEGTPPAPRSLALVRLAAP